MSCHLIKIIKFSYFASNPVVMIKFIVRKISNFCYHKKQSFFFAQSSKAYFKVNYVNNLFLFPELIYYYLKLFYLYFSFVRIRVKYSTHLNKNALN